MKTPIITFTLLLISAFWSGCLEYTTTTRVQRDGSLQRTLEIVGDSASTQGWTYLLPIDSSWSAERSRIDEKKWELKAWKSFSSDREANEYQNGMDHRILKSTVTLDRTFAWFTTRYAYTEVIHSFNTFNLVPITEHISPAELNAFLESEVSKKGFSTKGDSMALEDASDRYEEWQRRSEFASYFQAFKHGAEQSGETKVTPATLDKEKERIYAIYLKSTTMKGGSQERLNRERFEKWVASPDMKKYAGAVAASKKECDSLVSESDFVQVVLQNAFKTVVEMPGRVISTNARTTEGNVLSWEDYISYVYIQDFTIQAESQEWNWWAVIATGVVILGGPIAIALRRRMKRQRGF